jgi:hypothetical protein
MINRTALINSSLELSKDSLKQTVGMHKRKASVPFGYNTGTVTKEYHIVNGREGLNRANLTVELNEHPSSIFKMQYKVDRHAPRIHNYADRVPIADESYPPNAARFDMIDKSPTIHTRTKNLPNVRLDKFTSRAYLEGLALKQKAKCQADYEEAVKVKEKMIYSEPRGGGVKM